MNHSRAIWKKLMATVVAFATCFVLAGSANAAVTIGNETNYLKIGGLLQGWYTFTEDAAPDGDAWEHEFYLRRMRLMFYGQLWDFVNFFVETDNPNFGKGGNTSGSMFIQDAYLELNFHEMIQLDAGMLLVPFSHHGMQGATSLLGLDYHSALIKYPTGSHKVWRDYGIMLRGLLTKWVEYRVGLFNGVHGNGAMADMTDAAGQSWEQTADPRNHKDAPRLTARLTFNVFEPEGGAGVGGMFYDGIYLKKTEDGITSPKKVLSVGGSVDWQKDLVVVWDNIPTATGTNPAGARAVDARDDYVAAAADVFWDIPLGAKRTMSINGQVNFYYYNYGDQSDANFNPSNGQNTGLGLSAEVGFRYQAFQPVFLFDWYDATKQVDDKTGDYMGVWGGFNYWLLGHSTCFKIQFGGASVNGADNWGLGGRLQAQLVF